MNEETGEREPIQGCKRKDNPKLCKADYPRTTWLVEKSLVICPGLAEKMSMPAKGKKSKIGCLHGPSNHEYLNATHPAILAAHRFNSDVQLPYRFPVMAETHYCEKDCGIC